jgi:hypothetical protein
VAFHIGLVFWGLVPNLVSRPLHMALVLPWIFVYAATTRRALWTGVPLALLRLGRGCIWIALNHDRLGDQFGFLETPLQFAVASDAAGGNARGRAPRHRLAVAADGALALGYGCWPAHPRASSAIPACRCRAFSAR